jgi:hypothetical protein
MESKDEKPAKIVKTTIESIHGSKSRMIFYKCIDSDGKTHKYGPVITSDEKLDAESLLDSIAKRVQQSLDAAAEDAKAQKEAGELAVVLIGEKFDKAVSPELSKLLAESLATTLVSSKDQPELAKLLKEVEDEVKKVKP